jgi:hypothetical protein
MVRLCLEISNESHPDVHSRIVQIEVKLDERGELPQEYLNTNPSGKVSPGAHPN